MKVLLYLILIISANALNQEILDQFVEKMQTLGMQCAQEVHASADDLNDLVQGKKPTSHEGKCTIFCVQRKLDMLNDDGSINKVGSILAIEEIRNVDLEMYKKVLSIFVSCGESVAKASDPCDTATELAMCGQEKGREMGLEDILG